MVEEEQQSPSDPKTRRVFFLVPTHPLVGLTSVSLGLVRALDREGLRVGFFKPIRQPDEVGPERSTHFLRTASDYFRPPKPFSYRHAEELLNSGNKERLLQDVLERFETAANDTDIVVVEGLQPTAECPELETLNQLISKALDADVIVVSTLDCSQKGFLAFQEKIETFINQYGGAADLSTLGCILNKVNAPKRHISGSDLESLTVSKWQPVREIKDKCSIFCDHFPLIGAIPWDPKMLSPRMYDMARHLRAKVIYEGELKSRRVVDVKVIARLVKNMLSTLRPDTLIITPYDRDDIVLAVCMAALNGVPLAGIVLTGGEEPDARVMKLCEKAFQTGLPLLLVDSDSYVTAAKASKIDSGVPIDDQERIDGVMDNIAAKLDVSSCLMKRIEIPRKPHMSPAAFMYKLAQRARVTTRRIVLPEGHDPRIIKAAAICHEREIAKCVLLGDPKEINRLADAQGISIPSDVEILEPSTDFRKNYVKTMVALRKHKGLTEVAALSQLEDISVLGTMMLAQGEVDGLVSGAVNSTANTVRPALQLIKTHPNSRIISSIFFMCLPEQVVIYGDCAINPDPNAEELADIALQSAASAEAFGVEPRVAMISYSTGSSGKGSDVDKVREATKIAQERRPDLLIDGPLQFDAATTPDVAKSKAPTSNVAGRATVLVFPDLNTGNTTYKAVQRTANVVAVGPMLQGLNRPVNDLSRGALVDDIVFTIALTAIQAHQVESTDGSFMVVPKEVQESMERLSVTETVPSRTSLSIPRASAHESG